MQAQTESSDSLIYFRCGVCQTENYVPEEAKLRNSASDVFFRCNICGCENKVAIEQPELKRSPVDECIDDAFQGGTGLLLVAQDGFLRVPPKKFFKESSEGC